MLNGKKWAEEPVYVYGNVISGQFAAGMNGWQPLYTVNFLQDNPVTVNVSYPGSNTYSWSLLYSNGYVPWYGYGTQLSFDLGTGYPVSTSATFRITVTRSAPCSGTVIADYTFINTSRGASGFYTIYPNPVSSILHFVADPTKAGNRTAIPNTQCEVQLITVQTGTLVFRQVVPNFNNSFDIDVSTVRDGLYVLRMIENGQIFHIQPIMVQH